MKVKATIESGNGKLETVVVDIDARDRRAFETMGRKEFGIPLGANLQEAVKGMPESYVGWLVWYALKRANNRKDIDSWQSFEMRLLRTEALEEEAEVFGFPTQTEK